MQSAALLAALAFMSSGGRPAETGQPALHPVSALQEVELVNSPVYIPLLGISVQEITPQIRGSAGFNAGGVSGVLVSDVPDGSAANVSGLEVGDVIELLNGLPIHDVSDLKRAARSAKVANLTLARGRQQITVNVTRTTGVENQSSADVSESGINALGLLPGSVNDSVRQMFDLPPSSTGVVILRVAPGSIAQQRGLRGGDIVTYAGGRAITSVRDLKDAESEMRSAGRPGLFMLVRRNGTVSGIVLPFDRDQG